MVNLHFLRVPVDIRLQIYEFSLDANTPCPSPCLGSRKKWHQVGQKPVFYRRYGCLVHKSSANLYSGIVYTCKQIFREAQPVFFTVNTFKWINHQAANECLGTTFDRIQRLELYTWFWESCDIVLPTSCRSLKLILWRGLNSKRPLESAPGQLQDSVVISRWVKMLNRWRKDGVRQITMSHMRGDSLLHNCLMAISVKAGVVRREDRLGARGADDTL